MSTIGARSRRNWRPGPGVVESADEQARKPRGPRGPIEFSTLVLRTEVGVVASDEGTDDLDWHVTYRHVEDSSKLDPIFLVAIGHLRVRAAETFARATVGGFLRIARSLDPDGRSAATTYLPGFLEELYDAGRRTLNSVAGAMDTPSLEIPRRAPDVEIHEMDPPLAEQDEGQDPLPPS